MNSTAADRLACVTGGAGFLGSHLCERLLDRGWRVLAVDDLSTGQASHLEELMRHPRFTTDRRDIARSLPRAMRKADVVFNLACPASPAYYQQHPVQTTLSSVLGMWRILELLQRSGGRVVHTSTSEVYGDPEVHPQAESYHGLVNPIGPRSCYDEGKRCAEALAFAYHRERGVQIRIARLFNSYGPRLRPGDGRVVSNFIVQALRGEPITLYGDGQQTRSFCYVDDTIDGILALAEANVEGPINIGNDSERTVLELAERVLAMTGSRSIVVRRPLPPDDPKRRRPDITLARTALGWSPRVSLEDGLERTIAWFRDRLAIGTRTQVAMPSWPILVPVAGV